MKKIMLLISFNIFSVSSLFSYTFLGRESGNPVHFGSPDAAAMGGAGVSSSRWGSIPHNPALPAFYSLKGVSFAPGYFTSSEKIAAPDELAKFNHNRFIQVPNAAFFYSFSRLSFFAGQYSLYDFNYKNTLNEYSGSSKISSLVLDNEGVISALAPGAALKLGPLYLGAAFEMRSGKIDRIYEEHLWQTSVDISTASSVSLTGSGVKIGAILSLGENFRLGFAFQPEVAMTGENEYAFSGTTVTSQDFSDDVEWKYPGTLTVGFTRIYDESDLSLEMKKTDWTSVNEKYFSTTEFHLGVDHALRSDFSLRYGIFWIPYYGNKSVDQLGLTLGGGYN
ncbi:MAG TPA: hypothetical protein VJC03_06540, partial [bacterium]|nr:hypothetical protein [bacterium]